MRIKVLYKRVIRDIMKDHGISPSYRGHVVAKDATFEHVVQYTDHYVGTGNDQQPNARPDYRYRRYHELLSYIEPCGRRAAHVDLGCGAGLFSWVFLDWATDKDVDPEHIDLYGLDRSSAMICLAQEIRARLMCHISSYPEVRYSHKVKRLLRKLKDGHQKRTDYTVTFGHVLAQAHSPNDVRAFTRVIVRILKLMDSRSNCKMLAVDARNDGARAAFNEGWRSLLKSLESANIGYAEQPVSKTFINDDGCARIASLYLEQD